MWLSILSSSRQGVGVVTAEAISVPVPFVLWMAMWLRWWRWMARATVLLVTDLSALMGAILIGYGLWAGPVLGQPFSLYAELYPLLILFPLGYAGAGLYPGFGMGAVEILRRLSCCTSFAFLILAAASFVMKLPDQYSRMMFVVAWGCSLCLVPLLRFLVLAVTVQWRWWREPAVLFGTGEWTRWTIRALDDAFSLGYRPVAVIAPDGQWPERVVENVPVLQGPEWIHRVAEQGIGVVFVREGDPLGVSISQLQQHFRRVVVIREDWDLPVERVHVRNLGGVLGVEFTNNLLLWRNRVIKRALDLGIGVLSLVGTLPLLLAGAVALKLRSRGPIFFRQEREGLDGRRFAVWKLRTMYVDAEQRLAQYLATNPALRQEWETHFKLAHDPRVIPGVGAFLRRWSVDELPQLWNVVKGDMSLVGPRPFPEYHLQQFSAEFRELRRCVRPGLTGMWQVTVRSEGGIEAQKAYDAYYIRNWSIWVDLHILARTAFTVLAGRGAY